MIYETIGKHLNKKGVYMKFYCVLTQLVLD